MRTPVRHFLGRWPVIVSLSWLVRYATLGHIPFRQTPIWSTWFDQSRYLASAAAFAHGDLSPSAHWYPLGYSLVAAPFVWLLPRDPFFLLDLLLFLLTCKAFIKVAGRLGIAPWPATICYLAATLVQTGLASTWVQPWTTTLSAALIWWLLDRTLAIGEDAEAASTPGLVGIGALVAALPLTRPVDGLIGVACLAFVGAALFGRRILSVRAVLAVAAGGAAVTAAYAALHLAIYGLHPTAYMMASAKLGFIWSDIGWKAYVLLVSARPWYPDSDAILAKLPWIVPGCAGLITAAITTGGRQRRTLLLLSATIVPASIMMLAYADLQPPGLWRFNNIHYFKWFMPALAAGVLLCCRLAARRRDRPVLAVVLVVLMLPLAIRIVPVRVDDRTPARMLLFKGARGRDWNEAYFAPVVIDDDRGGLRNVADFHQLPDPAGERAVAISRLFAGHPQRRDPGEPSIKARQSPDARFGERLSLLGL